MKAHKKSPMHKTPNVLDVNEPKEFCMYVKTEGAIKTEDYLFMTKTEDQHKVKCEDNPIFDLSQFNSYSKFVNQRFDGLLLSLEHYLESFITVEDFDLQSTVLSNMEIQNLVSESKTYFKEWGLKVLRVFRKELKAKAVQHVLPDSHLIELVEITKRRIFNSYKQLKKNISERLDSLDQQVQKKEANLKPQKKILKRKCDFPSRARAILKSWFIAHAQDPYPSHEEKIALAREGGISMKQLENWLTNTRGRVWKKLRYETKFDSEIQNVLFKNEEMI